jgi:hypothetical protein
MRRGIHVETSDVGFAGSARLSQLYSPTFNGNGS